jgi:hypothetical protein
MSDRILRADVTDTAHQVVRPINDKSLEAIKAKIGAKANCKRLQAGVAKIFYTVYDGSMRAGGITVRRDKRIAIAKVMRALTISPLQDELDRASATYTALRAEYCCEFEKVCEKVLALLEAENETGN